MIGMGLLILPVSLQAAESTADYLWRTGPNLVPDGDFNHPNQWRLIDPRRDEQSYPEWGDALPVNGEVIVYRQPMGLGRSHNVLAMYLSGRQIRSDGVCQSADIPVVPNMRYRLEYRCRTGGPQPLVLVRGMATIRDDKGNPTLREMRQWRFVSLSPPPEQWITIRQELTTEDAAMPIRVLRIELGGRRTPGYLFFDHFVLKAIGRPQPPPMPTTTQAATRPTTQSAP